MLLIILKVPIANDTGKESGSINKPTLVSHVNFSGIVTVGSIVA